jgi:hypothetical protein
MRFIDLMIHDDVLIIMQQGTAGRSVDIRCISHDCDDDNVNMRMNHSAETDESD